MIIKRNPRNTVIITPFIVLKYRRDLNLRKIFWEFVLTWKAFLHGVSEMPILVGPVMIRKTAKGTIFAKANLKSRWVSALKAVAALSKSGVDHKELRHPQYHMIVKGDGAISILDFERGKLTKKPRNLSRFVVWLLERGVNADSVERELDRLKGVPESDLNGARKAIRRWRELKQSAPQETRGSRSSEVASD